MSNLKKLVFRCYTYHRSDYLLRFCSYLARYPREELEYVNNWDSTTSLYHKSTGKLLVTFRNENMVCTNVYVSDIFVVAIFLLRCSFTYSAPLDAISEKVFCTHRITIKTTAREEHCCPTMRLRLVMVIRPNNRIPPWWFSRRATTLFICATIAMPNS